MPFDKPRANGANQYFPEVGIEGRRWFVIFIPQGNRLVALTCGV